MDDETHEKAERVGDDVALAAHDLLSGVEATNYATFGGLDRLAVDDGCGGAGLSAFALVRCHRQLVVDSAKPALVAPPAEIFLHRRERRKVLRQ